MAGARVRKERRFAGHWLVVAALAAVIPAWLTVMTVGECQDSVDPALSACTSGPPLGDAGTVVVWGLWAVFAFWCIGLTFRSLR